MSALDNHKLQEFLDSQTHDELQWILARYCGPHDMFLFDKRFHYLNVKQHEMKREVERRIFTTLLEDQLNL